MLFLPDYDIKERAIGTTTKVNDNTMTYYLHKTKLRSENWKCMCIHNFNLITPSLLSNYAAKTNHLQRN